MIGDSGSQPRSVISREARSGPELLIHSHQAVCGFRPAASLGSPRLNLANDPEVHCELVISVKAQKLIEKILVISGNSAGPCPYGLTSQIEVLAHVASVEEDDLVSS